MQASECIFSIRQASAGNVVMAYESFNSIKPLLLEPPKILNNRFGQFAHEKIISTPISSKVYDMKNESYIRCLSPTPELWTKALQMRTQILYRPDISMITGRLDVKPGSVIVEAGTGSGSLSMSFVRALLPTGKLFTYEFNEARANQAQKEFQMLGLGQFVVSEHRDVVQSGLGHKEMEKANGVFLDLPNPWAVIKSAYEVLDDSGVICTFSPCIEQVQKNCEEMERVGFHNIVSLETLSRPFNVKMNGEKLIVHHNNQDERLHTGYLSFGYK